GRSRITARYRRPHNLGIVLAETLGYKLRWWSCARVLPLALRIPLISDERVVSKSQRQLPMGSICCRGLRKEARVDWLPVSHTPDTTSAPSPESRLKSKDQCGCLSHSPNEPYTE